MSTYWHKSIHVKKYGIANAMMTVSTNVTVTALITFHVLRAHRALAKVLPLDNLRLYTGVVAILIESALPLSIFGIVTAALILAIDAPTITASEGLLICYNTFSALFFIFSVSSSLWYLCKEC
jgi:hypothetical protein